MLCLCQVDIDCVVSSYKFITSYFNFKFVVTIGWFSQGGSSISRQDLNEYI